MAIEQTTSVNVVQQEVEYREIPGFPDYKVGNDGTVLSWNLSGQHVIRGNKRKIPKTLRQAVDKIGRRWVNLCLNSKKTKMKVATLVLTAFFGTRPEGMECCHNDGNPANNHISNLRWDTHANNQQDMTIHGRTNRGEKSPVAKLKESDVLDIRKALRNGERPYLIARRYGIINGAVYMIRDRKRWGWLPDTIETDALDTPSPT